MKQLLILSGKGGTGKTTLAGALIQIYNAKAYADCDVDAPNLHLIAKQTESPVRSDYYGMEKAVIHPDLCVSCGACAEHCRFGAVLKEPDYRIDPIACEGCGVCSFVCPVSAISMEEDIAGELFLYRNDHVFSDAVLKMGRGTSGKLVTQVKQNLTANASDALLAILDGSPGIGCPVIASVSGVSYVLIVTEPTLSGMSDLTRLMKTLHQFGAPHAVCVNKADLNNDISHTIELYCTENGIPFLGTIPYDPQSVKLVNEGKSILHSDSPSADAIRRIALHLNILMEQEA